MFIYINIYMYIYVFAYTYVCVCAPADQFARDRPLRCLPVIHPCSDAAPFATVLTSLACVRDCRMCGDCRVYVPCAFPGVMRFLCVAVLTCRGGSGRVSECKGGNPCSDAVP